jgi:hypothetical protein
MLRSPKTWVAACWVVSFGAMLAWLWQLSMLFDSDSYYHLAIAREYARRGVFSDLEWARFSVMRHGFGDKELLFHLLLVPFAAGSNPVFGAKLAMACLSATIAATLAQIAVRAMGVLGLAIPALLLGGSIAFDLRLIRLRPELLALLLLLWTIHALSVRRYRSAAALALCFALAYTALHALLGACLLCFLCALWLDRKPSFGILLWPLLGALIGLALHPHFPHNLRIFYLQNVQYWRFADQADVGNEIQALGWLRWLRFDWPLLLGIGVLAFALERTPVVQPPDSTPRASAWFFSSVALAFCAAFVHSGRFALYALPFSLLALCWLVRLHGLSLDQRLRRLGPSAPRTWLAIALVICIAAPLTAAELSQVADRGGCLWPAQRRQLEALGRAMPDAARVAAPWSVSEDYIYFAPQGRYLNLLDPVFMRFAHPHAYLTQRRLFAGELFDIAPALYGELDSDYIAFNAPSQPKLHEQLQHDPRFVPLIAGGHALYHVELGRDHGFVLDYHVGASRESALSSSAVYPRDHDPRARRVEAFVDTTRLPGSERCRWFATPASRTTSYEFDASGAAQVWLDAKPVHRVAGHARLLIGSGERLEIAASERTQQLSIEVCSGTARAVFYLRRLD